MSSFTDHTIFNSINPDALQPKARKPLPFPLENFEQEISDVYVKLDGILKKLDSSERNPVNHTPARKKRIKNLKYKTKTCLNLIREISSQCSELWY